MLNVAYRIAVFVVGLVLIGLGIVGLFLPFLQGILLIGLGLSVLSLASERVARWVRGLKQRGRRIFRRWRGEQERAEDEDADAGERTADRPRRIVSLIASSTEIVCALGLRDRLVGRSHECDFPADVRDLPVCTEPKFADGTSYEIDQRVKAILQEGLSVYRVHADVLDELAPDLIITQTQCDVCAVSLDDVQEAVRSLVSSRPRIVSLEPNALEDVFADIQAVADALGVPERGTRLVEELRGRMDAIERRATAIGVRPTVACIEWIDPLMAAGNWMPELVELAGGRSVVGRAGEHAPWLAWDELVALDPEVIIALPCGFDIPRTLAELPALTERPEWSTLKAVAGGRAFVADGNQFFNRPGPRVAEALEIMAEILHPETFDFGHRGQGWQPLPSPRPQQRPAGRTS